MRSGIHFIWRLIFGRVSRILLPIHWILFGYCYFERGSDPFHFQYESLLLRILLVLDFPSLYLVTLIGNSLTYEDWGLSSLWWKRWAINTLAVIVISIQWGLIGYVIERIGDRLLGQYRQSKNSHGMKMA